MFAKLLKHEWKASAGLLGILSGAVLGIGLAGGFALRALVTVTESAEDPSVRSMASLPLGFFLFFAILALAVYGFVVQFVLLSRFYKSRFTDEGYLTFTLPVNTWENYLSALANISIWNVISALVITVAVITMSLLGISGMPKVEVSEAVGALTESYGKIFAMEGYGLYMTANLIYGVVSFLSAPVLMMTCLTLGAVLAKKHKILAAIGIYYGMSMAVGILTSFASTVTMMGETGMLTSEYYGAMAASAVIQTLIQVLLCAGGSCLSVWLMDKKLNLP